MNVYCKTLALFLVLLLILTSCSTKKAIESNPEVTISSIVDSDIVDSAAPDQDIFWFAYDDIITGVRNLAESPDGYYFCAESYLYWIDKATLNTVILCARPECQHFGDDRDLCYGYVGPYSFLNSSFLAFYRDKLYVCSKQFDGKLMFPVLTELSPDGTLRRQIAQLDSISSDHRSQVIHRGYFYYIHAPHDENANPIISLRRINLSNGTEDILYTAPDNSISMNYLKVYGNRLYYIRSYQDAEGEYINQMCSMELDRWEEKPILTIADGLMCCTLLAVEDKLLAPMYYRDDKWDAFHWNLHTYTAETDGSSPVKWAGELPYGGLMTDGKYIYTMDIPHFAVPDPKQLCIFNSDGTCLQTFPISELLPEVNTFYVTQGEHLFISTFSRESNTTNLYVLSKSELLQGIFNPVLTVSHSDTYPN